MCDANGTAGGPVALLIQPHPPTTHPTVRPPQNELLRSASCFALVGVSACTAANPKGALSSNRARHIKNQVKASLASATVAAASSFKGTALPFLVLTTEEDLAGALQAVHQEAEGVLGMLPRMPVRG